MVNLTNHKIAFDIINEMVRSDNSRIEGISNIRRVKYIDYFDEKINTPYYDIGQMNDFIEKMRY
jgi:hypothetical protein